MTALPLQPHAHTCCLSRNTMIFLPGSFEAIAQDMWNAEGVSGLERLDTKFCTTFGVSSRMCSILWAKMEQNGLNKASKPKNLLWALQFFKHYTSEEFQTNTTGCCRQTLAKWVWPIMEELCDLCLTSKNGTIKLVLEVF